MVVVATPTAAMMMMMGDDVEYCHGDNGNNADDDRFKDNYENHNELDQMWKALRSGDHNDDTNKQLQTPSE